MRRRLLKAILVLFLLSRALDVAAQPIVKVQAPGSRSPATITVSGRVIDFDAQALSGVRVGIATVDGPEEWMPAGRVCCQIPISYHRRRHLLRLPDRGGHPTRIRFACSMRPIDGSRRRPMTPDH